MADSLEVGIIAAAATCVAACISAFIAFAVARRNTFVEDRTAKVILLLMRHGRRQYRTFDIIRRRLGGFSDDELRKLLIRAGAVRFYIRFDEVYLRYLPEAEATKLSETKRAEPVEVWALLSQPLRGWQATLATAYFRGFTTNGKPAEPIFPPEYNLEGFLHEGRD